MTIRIYTKTGDSGETGLFGGQRVLKDDVRVEAYGAVDELNAALGLAQSGARDAAMCKLLQELQSLLFEAGAVLATSPERKKMPAAITLDDVAWLEQSIDDAEKDLMPLRNFILPGGCAVAAALHVARGVCRRAERRCVTLMQHDEQREHVHLVVMMLNRLGDLLFVLARLANARAGVDDVLWTARVATKNLR